MTEDNFNWTSFQHAILLDADLEEVFKYVATADGICRWFLGDVTYRTVAGVERPLNEIASIGDHYIWKWQDKDFATKGEILDCQINSLFQFTFGSTFEVVIRLSSEQERTRLTLGQEYRNGAVEDQFQYLNCCVCWVFFMTNLKSVIEGGKDLREREVDEELLVNR